MRRRMRLLRLMFGTAWRAEPKVTVLVFTLFVTGSVSLALAAWFTRMLVDAAVAGQLTLTLVAAGLAALFQGIDWAGGRVRTNLEHVLAEHIGVVLYDEVLRMTAGIDGIEHLERPDYLDRIAILRRQRWELANALWATANLARLAFGLSLTLLLLAGVHPALVLVVPVAAAPLLLHRHGQARADAVLTETAEGERLERHLTRLAVSADTSKDVRIARAADELDGRARQLWHQVGERRADAQTRTALLHVTGSAIFVCGFVVGLGYTLWLAMHGRATLGDVMLVITLATQLTWQVGDLVFQVGRVAAGGRILDRYVWLADYADARTGRVSASPDLAPVVSAPVPPERITDGITFDSVSFRYPSTDREVLRDVSLHIPAGTTVAVVGAYGAGKTTLVKLLCRLYEPTTGSITVDGVPLSEFPAPSWRERVSAAFQDFSRFQLLARETVGVGDLPRIDVPAAVGAAVDAAGADEIVRSLPDGLGTQLGKAFPGGVDLSGGQWQKLALARASMRQAPLLLILDEPTASLDAPSERALFERYASAAQRHGRASGAITVLVTHRFSTVRMADLIVVVSDGRITEQGSHAELMHRGGIYAELFQMQADAYT